VCVLRTQCAGCVTVSVGVTPNKTIFCSSECTSERDATVSCVMSLSVSVHFVAVLNAL
jgi:hypothetical protein